MKFFHFLMTGIAVLSLASCNTDYYEPVFGYDNLPEVVPPSGGVYELTYSYDYYDTKASSKENFEWEYRVLIDGREYYTEGIRDSHNQFQNLLRFQVEIPANLSLWPRSIIIEASTHVYMDYEDWWGDWTPIASAVQLAY